MAEHHKRVAPTMPNCKIAQNLPGCNGKSPNGDRKQAIWADHNLHLPSKLAWRWAELSWRSGKVKMSKPGMAWEMKTYLKEIDKAIATITKDWQLFSFSWDDGRGIFIPERNGASADEFKLRVQRRVRGTVGVAWILADMVEKYKEFHTPVPHSYEEFMKQLDCTRMTVTTALKYLTKPDGHFVRYNRSGRGNKPYYVDPDDDVLISSLDKRFS